MLILITKSCASALAIAALLLSITPATAQSPQQDRIDTAKPADTVSPYGVSYTTGSFTYSLPLFTIGHGDWPNKMTVILNYDSSGARNPNDPWTLSIDRRISGQYTQYETGFEGEPIPELHRYGLNIVLGNERHSFSLGGPELDQSNFASASKDGSDLRFSEMMPGSYSGFKYYQRGTFLITDRVGTEIEFEGGLLESDGPLRIASAPILTLPNGHVIDYSGFTHWNGVTRYRSSSTGIHIRRFGDQVCAFNAAITDMETVSSCSGSPLIATINTTRMHNFQQVTSVTLPDGGTYRFEYEEYSGGGVVAGGIAYAGRRRSHLACVKEPGQSNCAVRNTYDPCDGPGIVNLYGQEQREDVDWTGGYDRVSYQILPDGRRIDYSFSQGSSGWSSRKPCRKVRSATMREGGSTSAISIARSPGNQAGSPGAALLTDPLSRTVEFEWTGANSAGVLSQHHQLASITQPGGERVEYTYDDRGNRIESRLKSSEPEPDIVTIATFPSVCSNRKTCNKPTTVTDAEGNTTTFTYSSAHGGVLSMVGPAVNGVSPATKYYYVQREAWLKDGGGYAKTGVPIWMLSEERICRTSSLNLSSGTCSGGSGDLVQTRYDYGPDSGPNNLWLRGVAVTANGETLRTCYSYDELGRRVSETQPNAGLASCP